MTYQSQLRSWVVILSISYLACFQVGCARSIPAERLSTVDVHDYDYVVGPGDTLNVFVWGVPDLSQVANVRPDGRVSLPLVEDLVAGGKTPTQLAREIEQKLSLYVRQPKVTVVVGGAGGNFRGGFDTQIRIIGEVGGTGGGASGIGGGMGIASGEGSGAIGGLSTPPPKTMPYIRNMTLIDVMAQAGGLTPFAAGNRAKLVRTLDGQQQEYRVRLQDLLGDGDLSANVKMAPGDILVVPTAWF